MSYDENREASALLAEAMLLDYAQQYVLANKELIAEWVKTKATQNPILEELLGPLDSTGKALSGHATVDQLRMLIAMRADEIKKAASKNIEEEKPKSKWEEQK